MIYVFLYSLISSNNLFLASLYFYKSNVPYPIYLSSFKASYNYLCLNLAILYYLLSSASIVSSLFFPTSLVLN